MKEAHCAVKIQNKIYEETEIHNGLTQEDF